MSSDRLVVVGGVAAGLSAASRARRVNPRLEILVYEKGPDISYSACGLPYLISGQVAQPDTLRVYSPEFFRAERNIQVFTEHEVTEILPGRRRIIVAARGAGLDEVHYGHLILATGAEPARPDVPGIDLQGVFHVNDLQSAVALKQYLATERPRHAVVIGGGYIGLEMADALRTLGIEVTLLTKSQNLFESVDEEIQSRIEQTLAAHSVKLVKGAAVEALAGAKRRLSRVSWDSRAADADLAILATGVRPRTALATQAGLRLGPTGAIEVNEFMETSEPGIYAAGDAVECRHLVTGKPIYFPLGTTANKQGRVAGENAAGGRARFAGIVGTAVVKVFELELGRTGLSLGEARAAGFSTVAATVQVPSRARYMGGKDIRVHLVADRNSGRLLGAQMAGPEGVAKRIDVFAAALTARMTVEQISQLDLSYAPPFAPVWDPVLIACQEMLRELRR
jgi:CoA-dependent NAD(P)H sulfur oxidoreductase